MNDHAQTSPKAAQLQSVLTILSYVDSHAMGEGIKIARLPFWRSTRPHRLANELDRVLVRLRKARPAPGAAKTLARLLVAGRKAGRDAAWLGEQVAELYRCRPVVSIHAARLARFGVH